MPSIHSSGSVGSAQSDHRGKSAQPADNSSTGTQRVNSHPHPTPTIPRQENHGKPEDVLVGAQPTVGRRLVGSSAEEQLGQLICDQELVECYKLRAKDVYFEASLHALKTLQNVVAEKSPALDAAKMAKEFKKALNVVQSQLKDIDGINAADLHITIDTPQYGKVRLIPFSLESINHEQLTELLNIARDLTNDAVQKWRVQPDYPALREKYIRSIAQYSPQIDNLLTSIHPDHKEIFRKRIDVLQFPRIQILCGPEQKMTIENAPEHTSSPAPIEPPKQNAATTEDRMMDEAVKLYQQHSQLDDPEGYVKKQKALALELQKLQRIARVAPAVDTAETKESLVEERLPDEADSLFRGILALVNMDRRWINDASREEFIEEISRADFVQSIKFVITEIINAYREFAPHSAAQHVIAARLREEITSVVTAIYADVFTHGEFSHYSVDDLATALGIEEMLTDETDDPFVLELRILVKMLYKGLLAEFRIPESDGRKPGLRWHNGHYSLIIAKGSPLAQAD